jgi:hypothetical protein
MKILRHVDPLLGNDREIRDYTTAVARLRLRQQTRTQHFYGNNSTATEDRCFLRGPCRVFISRTSEKLSEVVKSYLMSELEDCCGSVVVNCYCEKLVAEAGDSSGTQKKGNVRHWKPLPDNDR